MKINSFEQLDVWREAHSLVLEIYQITGHFPAEERFGLISQMRRAAVSVPANIAEGFKRRGSNDKVRFYNIAQSSLEELRYYIILCQDLRYLGSYRDFKGKFDVIAKRLNRLIGIILGR